MKKILQVPLRFITLLIGTFAWSPPIWLQKISRSVRQHLVATSILFFLAMVLAGTVAYFEAQPKPLMVKAEFENIQVTPNYANAKPSTLDIQFNYALSELKSDQARPSGEASVARIDLVGEEIRSGIQISPLKKGTWRWLDDKRIRFEPETDWPAGTRYKIHFEPSIFDEDVRLSKRAYAVTTPNMHAEFSGVEFYQDPKDTSVRKVVATLKFSHPVDQVSLEKSLTMAMRSSGDTLNARLIPYPFSLSFDKQLREVYVTSDPVSLPDQTNYMTLALDKGVKTILGGEGTAEKLERKVLIPDKYSFLQVESNIQVVRNKSNEPEQILMLNFTDDIDEQELQEKLKVFVLPKTGEANGRPYWRGPSEVNDHILTDSQKIDFILLPNDKSHAKNYNVKVDVPENRYVYVKVGPRLTSINDFVHARVYDTIIRSPNYPKELKIVGEGAVLSYSGNHELSVLTRGIPGIKYTVGRLLKGQLYHLISQTSGDITNPSFNNWHFNEKNIAEFQERFVTLAEGHPKEANYSSMDLTQFMPSDDNRFGLFFVEARGYDFESKREIYDAHDKRLILVTDLGILVKNNADNTHDLFVQSIKTGEPVAHASVELLGKNGLAIFTGKTNAAGRVSIPAIKNWGNEKQATVYVVKSGRDMSFIPYNRRSRQINLSKFDIGGVRGNAIDKNALNAYLFSDRGIYRPGETVNIGIITKRFDLSNIENVPLELVIRDPSNKELRTTKFNIAEKGFNEFQYSTNSTSDTGRYSASLHLIRDNKYRDREIGTLGFRVEEFQPDTMRIESRLNNTSNQGWNTNATIKAKISLSNLFGAPAQDRKVSGHLRIQPHNFKFEPYSAYTFTDPFFDPEQKPLSIDTSLGTKQTGSDGNVEFDLDLSKFDQGTYSLLFTAQGFEPSGGRSVTATNSTFISPLPLLVGSKADGKLNYINENTARSIEFIAIDNRLEKLQATDLKLVLKEVQNVSTLIRQKNGTYKYQSIKKETEVSKQDVTIPKDGYKYSIDTTKLGDFSLEIQDDRGRSLSRVQFSVVGFANLAGNIDKNAELQVKLNKRDYKPGETIEMNIKAPYKGAGLITIETNRVHNHLWFKTTSESTVQKITIPDDLEGSGYVNVAFIRDIGSKEVFSSPLSYAVEPFSIDKSKRHIDVSLKTESIVRPGKQMDINFSTSRASKIAIFAVDEGILQVAGYTSPDPLSYFLKKRALGVETMQILDLILPDFNLSRAHSASGGGSARLRALAKNQNPFTRKTDKPAVFWSGIYNATEASQSITFNVPDTFAGELRVMAVAVSDDAMGATSTSSLVRGPFVISPNVLTHAAPGDEFQVTVGIANLIEGAGKHSVVDISVEASEHLEILENKTTQLVIGEGDEGKFTFTVKAKDILGAASLKMTAQYKHERATRSASLSIRPATHYMTRFETGFEKSKAVKLEGLRALYSDLSEQSIAASSSPLVVVDGLKKYLETFPHGCTEQIVSQVFPIVGLMSHSAYAPHLDRVQKQFGHVIDKLRERQLADGGFAFWPGLNQSSQYPSIYVMHFLVEARDYGYPVPKDMMARGAAYLRSIATKKSNDLPEARDRAIAIYLLTRLGEVTTNAIVDLEDTLIKAYKGQWEADIVAVYMASTYKLLQKDHEANKLIGAYKLNSKKHEISDFHSLPALDAQYIYLLAKHFASEVKNINGDKILTFIEPIFRGEYNTISSAYTILALGAYSELVLDGEFNEAFSFEGFSFGATASSNQKTVLNAELSPFPKATYQTAYDTVKVSANAPFYYLNVQSGFDRIVPNKLVREGIEIHRSFINENGDEVSAFMQGQKLSVKLRVRALGGKYLNHIAIVDLLPGGFEVLREQTPRATQDWQADYIDIREDRVVFYGAFGPSVEELTYKVKLTASGTFVVPPSYAESMYDRRIRAWSQASEFSVIASQQ